MKNKQQNIDYLFKQGFESLKIDPPPHVLDRINEKLDDQKKKRRLFFIRTISTAAVIVIAFGAGLLINQNQKNQSSSQDNNTMPITAPVEQKPAEGIAEDKINQADKEKNTVEISDNKIFLADVQVINKTVKEEKTAKQEVLSEDTNIDRIHINKRKSLFAQNIPVSNIPVSSQAKPDISSINLNIKSLSDLIESKNQSKRESFKEKLSVGGQVSPSYSYKNSQNGIFGGASMNAGESTYMATPQEDALITVSGGVQMNYDLGSKWELASGIYYSVNGIITRNFFSNNNNYYAINSSSFNNTIGAIKFESSPLDYLNYDDEETLSQKANTPEESSDLVQHFEYLELPLLIKRNIIDEKIGLFVQAGINTGVLVGNNAFTTSSGVTENIGSTYGIKKISYNGIVGFGIKINIIEKLSFNMEPSFKYSLRQINIGPDKYLPWSINLFSGIVYHF